VCVLCVYVNVLVKKWRPQNRRRLLIQIGATNGEGAQCALTVCGFDLGSESGPHFGAENKKLNKQNIVVWLFVVYFAVCLCVYVFIV
jgi:hypothetical protein